MATAAGNGFDTDKFRKAVMYMDSPNENERRAFEGKAVQMCVERRVRFCDMVARAFGEDGKRVAELEAQLKQSQREGDELAAEADDALARKDAVIEEYRKAERARYYYCRPCETKRRTIAVMLGGAMLAGWFFKFPPQEVTHQCTGYGLLLASAPFVFLVCRWAILQFTHRNHWVTWRDNDVFRALAEWWNEFVEKFLIDV